MCPLFSNKLEEVRLLMIIMTASFYTRKNLDYYKHVGVSDAEKFKQLLAFHIPKRKHKAYWQEVAEL